MIQRYLGVGLTAAAMTFVTAQVLTVAFKDLPQVRKEEKMLKDMSSPEKPFKPNWVKSIKKAVKRRVEAIMNNPRMEVIVPMKVLGFCLVYFFLGHNIGYNQGLFDGARRIGDNIFSFFEQVTPDQFKPVVRAVLDKGIKKTTFFKNINHGFFKDYTDTCSMNWEKLWSMKYAEEVAKVC